MDPLKRLGLFLVFLVPFTLCAQEEAIEWSSDFRLSWSQFQGAPQQRSKIAAVTASGISYEFSSTERDGYMELEYSVKAHFYPKQSWYHPEMANDLILSHEQLHFDISELFARKMRQRMEATRFTKKVKAEVKEIYEEIIREMRAFQSRYDQETDFSRNRAAQLEWNRAVQAELGS